MSGIFGEIISSQESADSYTDLGDAALVREGGISLNKNWQRVLFYSFTYNLWYFLPKVKGYGIVFIKFVLYKPKKVILASKLF